MHPSSGLSFSAQHIKKLTNCSLCTGYIPSFQTRSIEGVSHAIDQILAHHHRENPSPISKSEPSAATTQTKDASDEAVPTKIAETEDASNETVPTKIATPPPGYFDSKSARALFQPRPEETVLQCLQECRIDLLATVIDDWPNGMPELLDGTVNRKPLMK
eukprot:scaffold80600_cov68-Attheya_sp.AAC.4